MILFCPRTRNSMRLLSIAADGKYGAYEEMRERLKMAVQSEQASTRTPRTLRPPTGGWKYEKQIRWAGINWQASCHHPCTMSQEDLDALERQVLYGH